MGQDTAAALTQVEQARGALEHDLATLLDRLPPGAKLAQTAAAGTGAVTALAAAKKLLSKRSEDKKYVRQVEREAQLQARAIAAAFAHAHVPTISTAALAAQQAPSMPGPTPRPLAQLHDGTVEQVEEDSGPSTLLLTAVIGLVAAAIAWVVANAGEPDADDIWLDRES